MKVKELKKILAQCDDETEISIAFDETEWKNFEVRHIQLIDPRQIEKHEKYVIRRR